uniref:6-phosphogluconate dehydrogenase NADP-binding domain-containing protein n=1 Tax=Esox lucius TaxID=8010 RepID=A0AAY5L0I5_ESOLU
MAAILRGSRNVWGRIRHVDYTLVSSRSMASKTQVGFIGLGNMGNPMAKNLLKHGYPVIATDVFPESCKELQELGAQIVDNPAEVADKADRIVTMLPSSPNVIDVYTGANGILKKVKKGSLLIDSSTIDPAVSKEMALAVEKMGAVFMDAPVSGGHLQVSSWKRHSTNSVTESCSAPSDRGCGGRHLGETDLHGGGCGGGVHCGPGAPLLYGSQRGVLWSRWHRTGSQNLQQHAACDRNDWDIGDHEPWHQARP